MSSIARRLGRVVALSEPRRCAAVAADLADVLAGRHLSVVFQPIAARRREGGSERWCIDGVEALLRGHTPAGSVLRPDKLLPAIERAHLVKPLFLFVFAESLTNCCQLRARGLRVALSVNVHAEVLQDDSLPGTICSLLEMSGVPAQDFTLELTETGPIVDMPRAAANLRRLRQAQVRVALDDFGSGFSTHTRLDCLEADEIKIDKALIVGVEHADEQRRIVEHVVSLAHARGMRVCAEGVETPAALETLGGLGVDRAQGYLIGRPQAGEALVRTLRAWGRECARTQGGGHPQLSLPGFAECSFAERCGR